MSTGVRCRGIVIQVGPSDMKPAEATRLARAVVRRRLRGKWKIRALSKHSRDVLLERATGRAIGVGRAWDLAERLARDRDVGSAEPSFRTSGLEPEQRAARGRPELGVAPKSFGREKHKACTEQPSWSLTLCRVQDAWELAPGPGGRRYGRGIVVGHPDTGYTRHDEIWDPPATRRILNLEGFDYEDGVQDPLDPLEGENPSHGTSTASVIMSACAARSADPGVSGVAPEAELIPFRVSDSVIHFDFTNVAEAIYQCVEKGAHVISMSLGGPFGSGFLERAIAFAIENGVIVLAAAGNVWPWVVYPAKYEKVIAVAAANCQKKPWRHSARGGAVDISAPGESVWRAETKKGKPDNLYCVNRSSGTSYAVATTAGAAALWLAHHGRARLIQRYGKRHLGAVFRELLVEYGFERPPGWDTDSYGVGILRADKLLSAPLPPRPAAAAAVPKGLEPRRNPVRRIADYLPGADHARLRIVLAGFLQVKEADLDETLARNEEELVFHVATNAGLRETLLAACRRSAAKGVSPRRGLAANESLHREASRTLRKQLGIGPFRKRRRRDRK